MTLYASTSVFWYLPEACCTPLNASIVLSQEQSLDSIFLQATSSKPWYPRFHHINSGSESALFTEQIDFVIYEATARPVYGAVYATRIFKTYCDGFNLKHFPFDSVNCSIELETDDDVSYINLSIYKYDLLSNESKLLGDNQIWQYMPGSLTYQVSTFGHRDYTKASFRMAFQRKADYYFGNIFLPILIMALLQLSAFFLEPDETERPMFCITVLLAFSVLITFIYDNTPKVSGTVYIIVLLECDVLVCVIITIYSLLATFLCKYEWTKVHIQITKSTSIRRIRILDLAMFSAMTSVSFLATILFIVKMINQT